MSAWGRLWRLRRQNDKVKLAWVMFLAAGYFAVSGVVQAAQYAVGLARPVEYVLAAPAAVGAERLKALAALEGVVAVSCQREYTLASGEKSLTVTELSEAYLAQCYGLAATGASRMFWLSPESYRAFLGEAPAPARLEFRTEEGMGSGVFGQVEMLGGQAPGAVTKGSAASLQDAVSVRVMTAHASLTGAQAAQMEALGFVVANRQALVTAAYETQLSLTRLGYGAITCLLALLAGRLLYATGKREVLGRAP
ncbi:hypothetical protein [Acutalibacter caecimuris]|uniref:hypothetical protein n=1 Tax=Acutalibacter caecimuris TaxID=3093657 RepID=UPI002AC96950|nr:hypothetical protein [Acutalibacter sp. M00118]